MSNRIEFEMNYNVSEKAAGSRSGGAMCLLFIGNLSGKPDKETVRGHTSLTSRRIHPVDVDNFDELMMKLSPRLSLQLNGESDSPIELDFKSLDDFHPDSLFERLGRFKALQDMRTNLLNKDTFPQAVTVLKEDESGATEEGAGVPVKQNESDDQMFERLLGKPAAHTETHYNPSGTGTEQLIRSIVKPHIVPSADPRQQMYVDSVDEAISSEMRKLLHHPEFQALEAAWRALYSLVSGLETGDELQLYLLDLDKQELLSDLSKGESDIRHSQLHQLLTDANARMFGEDSWLVIAGNFSFGASEYDTKALAKLGEIAADLGGPFLAAASPEIAGCSSFATPPEATDWQPIGKKAAESWHSLRTDRHAGWLGLLLPRILLRLPYGPGRDEIDSFTFDETAGTTMNHEDLLWGNPAFACALLLAQSFQANGKAMQTHDVLDLDDLPAFIIDDGEGKQLMPCAEIFLSERDGEMILDTGLMPLISHRQLNQVRLMRMQSIAEPLQTLRGPWDRQGH